MVWLAVLVLLSASLVGCAGGDDLSVGRSPAEDPAPSPDPGVTSEEGAALLAQADRLADEHEGRAVRVLAVRTRSSTGSDITGWSPQAPDPEVFILAISGDDYFCRFCSGPSDDGKRSTHLTLTVLAERPADERLTFGMSSTPYDLSRFGPVQQLRDG